MILHTFTTIVRSRTIFHLDSNNKNISSLHYSWLYMGNFLSLFCVELFVILGAIVCAISQNEYYIGESLLMRQLGFKIITTTLHWRETDFALQVRPCMPSPSSSYQPL